MPEKTEMSLQKIAAVCHEANRAYCEGIGDCSQPRWEDAPEWQIISAVDGVQYLLRNPQVSPEDIHNAWMQQKTKEGWVFGDIKDPDKKTHPCMLPYLDLPLEQRRKDHLFSAVVKALI